MHSERDPEINPWVQLMQKMIKYGDDGENFLELMKNIDISTALGPQVHWSVLLSDDICSQSNHVFFHSAATICLMFF